jgi:hypothetical protein
MDRNGSGSRSTVGFDIQSLEAMQEKVLQDYKQIQ